MWQRGCNQRLIPPVLLLPPSRLRRRMARKSNDKTKPGILARLGVLGLEDIEPAVFAALIQQDSPRRDSGRLQDVRPGPAAYGIRRLRPALHDAAHRLETGVESRACLTGP